MILCNAKIAAKRVKKTPEICIGMEQFPTLCMYIFVLCSTETLTNFHIGKGVAIDEGVEYR